MTISEIICEKTIHQFCDENMNDSDEGVAGSPCVGCELYEQKLCEYWKLYFEGFQTVLPNIVAYNRKVKLRKLLA